jgi:hypothetical protein
MAASSDYPAHFRSSSLLQFGPHTYARYILVRNTPTRHSREVLCGHALAVNQFVDPWAFDQIGWKYYFVYCEWLCFELVFVMLFIVETRGKSPEEIAILFDGEWKPDHLPQLVYNNTAIHMDNSPTREIFFTGACKERAAEAWELKMPHRVVSKDRLGHDKGRVRVL